MIDLRNVEKTYYSNAGNIHALKKTNLHINAGEIFGIIGLSGAGKSTLIRCINMLEVPTGGQVFVDGQELTAMNNQELRKARQNIGMIFQHFNLLASRTVYDNIAFPLEIQCGDCRYRKCGRSCGSHRDRRTGSGVLDVDFSTSGHVHQVLGGHTCCTFSREKCKW